MSACDTSSCVSVGTLERSRLGLLATIIVFVGLATAWKCADPALRELDELEHFEVVRHVATTGRLPIHDQADAAGFRACQEASPATPLLLLGRRMGKLLALPLAAPDVASEVPEHLVACGSSDVPYNKATWHHDPWKDAGPPLSGTLRTLHSLRFLSTLLQVSTLRLLGARLSCPPTGTVRSSCRRASWRSTRNSFFWHQE